MIAPDRFDEFFNDLYGYTPFPWQKRLALKVAQSDWPGLIDLPTASGKTSVIDAWVFALACQAQRAPSERTAPRRIAFVVDRRVIVDEAFERAAKLRDRLQDATDGILKEVADALRALAGSDIPLQCFQLRGGMYRDDDWARTPTQPTILTSTVDQIGSRLLFRSYGFVKQYMYPIHAGLAAYDMLVVLDEAHCAQPFEQTARGVERYRAWASVELPGPFRFVTMTATPSLGETTFGLNDEDRAHPVLSARLNAEKKTTLMEVSDDATAALVAQAEALATGGLKAIGVMVNRVATARRVYAALSAKYGADVLLLIGRMRPFDRDRVQNNPLFKLLLADQSRARKLDRPVFVVATQTLEVGANLDFDGLVTECASLDALRQRFGRLNRLGRAIDAKGVIIISSEYAKKSENDAVYGQSLAETWKWLKLLATSGTKLKGKRGSKASGKSTTASLVDMGINTLAPSLAQLTDEDRARLSQNPTNAPVMLPAHVDAWVQTAPGPMPEPDVALFLHGPERGTPEVKLVWRSDLDEQNPDEETWVKTVSLCPPTSVEALMAPLYLVKKWLNRQQVESPDMSDLEGAPSQAEEYGIKPSSSRQVLLWRGPDDSVLTSEPDDLLPGDAVIVPTSYGGWELFGHVLDDALDIAEPSMFQSKREVALRLHPATLQQLPACDGKSELLAMSDMEETPDIRELRRSFAEIAGLVPDYLRPLFAALSGAKKLSIEKHPTVGWVIKGRGESKAQSVDDAVQPFTNEDDSASLVDRFDDGRVTFMQHTSGVARHARDLAERCGLSTELVGDFELAGKLHDIGKADPRFQRWLYGCMGIRYSAALPLIAKSTPRSEALKWKAQSDSGYPKGSRHELLSVSLIQYDEALKAQAHDWDLVLHLIASHHGRCRPFAPVVVDPKPAEISVTLFDRPLHGSTATGLERLDSGVVERFWTLTRKYGWWGLAYLESIFRLADHHQSAIDTGR
jgi:CRISPR-associated endonuclease/helicase Cas3